MKNWKRTGGRLLAFTALGSLLLSGCAPTAGSGIAIREPVDSPYAAVAAVDTQRVENERFVLEIDAQTVNLRITDKQSGKSWTSSPDGAEDDPLAKNAAKMLMQSFVQIRYADPDGNLSTVNSATTVKKGGVVLRPIPNGVRVETTFVSEGIMVPLEVTLEDDSLRVSVPVKEIREDATTGNHLISILPMPAFGALELAQEGYLLVPDGSGALIEHSSVSRGVEDYKQYVYERDYAIERKTSETYTQTARLPVFGGKTGASGFVAVVHSGSARTCINASLGGYTRSYHLISPELIYRDYATVDVGKKTYQSIKFNLFEPQPVSSDRFELRYFLLEDEQADYVGMAARYRRYLLEEGGVRVSPDIASAPLYLELLGGVKRQESFLGIPMDQVVPLTSFADVRTITQTLRERGLASLVVNYTDWTTGGSANRIPRKLRADGALGSGKEWTQLQTDLQQAGVAFYPDLNFTDLYGSANGFSGKFDGTKTMQKNPLVEYRFKYSIYQPDPLLESTFLLRPAYMAQAVQQAMSAAGKLNVSGFSANSLGQKLYSDFGNDSMDRDAAQAAWQEALAAVSGATGKALFRSPNAYAFPYATHLTDVPVETSQFRIASRAVPFYQIALHGVLPMSLPSMNAYSDSRFAKLKALETGCMPKYTWGARNTAKVKGTELAAEMSLDYTLWLDEAVAVCKELTPTLEDIAAATIVSHRACAENVYETVYSNGTRVLVNYGEQPVTVDGQTVDAMDYYVEKGAGE